MIIANCSNTLAGDGCKYDHQQPVRKVYVVIVHSRFNENIRLEERRLVFNVDELRTAAARALGRPATEVGSLRKLAEGGINRV